MERRRLLSLSEMEAIDDRYMIEGLRAANEKLRLRRLEASLLEAVREIDETDL